MKWPMAPRKFHRVHMDVVGPFPVEIGGHKYICVFIDSLSHFTYLHAMVDKSATSVANALQAFICRYGWPKILISDNRFGVCEQGSERNVGNVRGRVLSSAGV